MPLTVELSLCFLLLYFKLFEIITVNVSFVWRLYITWTNLKFPGLVCYWKLTRIEAILIVLLEESNSELLLKPLLCFKYIIPTILIVI